MRTAHFLEFTEERTLVVFASHCDAVTVICGEKFCVLLYTQLAVAACIVQCTVAFEIVLNIILKSDTFSINYLASFVLLSTVKFTMYRFRNTIAHMNSRSSQSAAFSAAASETIIETLLNVCLIMSEVLNALFLYHFVSIPNRLKFSHCRLIKSRPY